MKILLCIDADHEPRMVAAYLAERFGGARLAIDLLQVIAPAATTAVVGTQNVADGDLGIERARRRALGHLDGIAATLRALSGTVDVNRHVAVGDIADTVAAMAERLGSALVVFEPRGRGRLERWRDTRLCGRLLRLAPCAVELVRPLAAAPRSLFNVLVPVPADRVADYPWAGIAALPWPSGTHLQLLGMLVGSPHDLPLETNAFRLIEDLSCGRALASRAGATLHDASAALAAAHEGRVTVDYALVEGADADTVTAQLERYRASLILACSPGTATQRGRALLAPDPAWRVAMQAPCTVLVLRNDDVGAFAEPATRDAALLGAR
ncbi:MAG: universal stress protein [Gammaproteobacteria bacterium]